LFGSTFQGLDSQACAGSELTSEHTSTFRNFGRTSWTGNRTNS